MSRVSVLAKRWSFTVAASAQQRVRIRHDAGARLARFEKERVAADGVRGLLRPVDTSHPLTVVDEFPPPQVNVIDFVNERRA